jgi:mRNA interferase MazF
MGVVADAVHRGDVFLVDLSTARGGELRKVRPGVVVSPDELNRHLPTCIIAPMTTGGHPYPFRVPCRFGGRTGHVVLDQIRTVDRDRLVKKLGRLSGRSTERSLLVLLEMFAP